MTTTNTTTNQTGSVEHIDPNTVIIEANVRPSAPITKEVVNSIRENGVLKPVLARRDEQGNILVRAGQRRTLGAREAGVATIPVYVVDADEKTTERIVQQMVENDQREALSDTDRAAAWQQLAFEGMSVATIAKRTGTKSGEVKSGLAVAGSTVAASAITQFQLTLDQALALTEFEDNERACAELVATAQSNPGQFPHALQRLRDARTNAELAAAKATELSEQGYVILDTDPSYDSPPAATRRYANFSPPTMNQSPWNTLPTLTAARLSSRCTTLIESSSPTTSPTRKQQDSTATARPRRSR